MLREALKNCDVKDKILIAKHSLPDLFQENLYGHPNNNNFDGIHLSWPDGCDHYTRSLYNIFQNVFPAHSRSTHNHMIPRFKSTPNPPPLNQSSPANLPTIHPNLPNKPDHITIDIDEVLDEYQSQDAYLDPLFPRYTVPTSNFFQCLGN